MYAKDGSGWFVEVFTQRDTDTAILSRKGLSGTKVLYDGQLENVAGSPGLYIRNRYLPLTV